MASFYFTYGRDENYPYQDGWTMVIADNDSIAAAVFSAYHPPRDGQGFLNCASFYDEENFMGTKMAKEGNFGQKCHEIIKVSRAIAPVKGDQNDRKA